MAQSARELAQHAHSHNINSTTVKCKASFLIIVCFLTVLMPQKKGRQAIAFKTRFVLNGRAGNAVIVQYSTKDEINVPIALSAFRDGDRGPRRRERGGGQ